MGLLFVFFQAEDGIRDLVRSRGLGDVYKRQSLDSAMSYYQQGLALDRSAQDQHSESSTRSSIANIFFKQNKLEHAELEAEHAVRIAREVGYPLGIVQATEVLHNVLANRGNWKRAMEILELHQQMKDSVPVSYTHLTLPTSDLV